MPYETDGAVATITLNRPERLNTIVSPKCGRRLAPRSRRVSNSLPRSAP